MAKKILVQVGLGVGIPRDLVMGDAEFVHHFADRSFGEFDQPLIRQFIGWASNRFRIEGMIALRLERLTLCVIDGDGIAL